MMTPRRCKHALIMTIAAAIPATHAAGSFTVQTAWNDTEEYFTAPIRWDREDWALVGVSAALIAGAHEYDGRVRTHFATGSRATLNGGDPNSTRDALPALAILVGTWSYAEFIDDRDGYRESASLLEAGVLSGATGELLKLAAGRERPNVSTSPNRWRDGGSAFPSVHTAAAFAIGMVFAESGNDDYRWVRRVLGYGVAAGTAYVRVRDNVHWLSDTVAGAALGIGTARFVLKRHAEPSTAGMLQIQPLRDGWAVNYVVALP